MKILLANKFYYYRGGADIHAIDLESLLKEKGHEVCFFSMQHPLNRSSDYSDFFPSEVDFNRRSARKMVSVITRPFGTREVRQKFIELLRLFKPDIVHLHNIHTQLSPALAVISHDHQIPVVWTLHDHKLVCPRYDCMRKGEPCKLCFTDKYNVLKYKCVKDSIGASTVALFESVVWSSKVINNNTDVFICPSQFLLNNMIEGGYDKNKLVHLPNFILNMKLAGVSLKKMDYYCFIGRLSPEKGIETLLKAAVELPAYELRVIGTGPLEDYLKEHYKRPNIKFLGFKEWEGMQEQVSNSKCLVFPSECFENNPLSIIESLCNGTPVIGSRIGGIPEMIQEGLDGFLYEAGNIHDLKHQIINLFQGRTQFDYEAMAGRARSKFIAENYYNALIKIYKELLQI